ncbi:MAG: STAS domain-containing protein, partial [Pseudonocardiaceae bacterium]
MRSLEVAMSVQPGHTGFLLSGAIESSQCAAGEIIVVRVVGEVDLCTIPILQTALDKSLGQYPAHLLVDLARTTFCSAQGLDLLTRTHR